MGTRDDSRVDPVIEVARRAARELGPMWSVTVRGQTVVIQPLAPSGRGRQRSVQLAELLQACRGMSDREREDLLAEAVRGVVASARDEDSGRTARPRDPDWCLPRLFPFLLPPRGGRRMPKTLVRRPGIPGLDVGVLVVDPEAHTLTPVTEENALAWGRSEDDLHAAALRNLAQHPIVPRIVGPGPAVLMRDSGVDDILSAAQVLLETRVRALGTACGSDELRVGLPAMDVAVAWPARSPEDARLRARAAGLYRASTNRLLRTTLLWVRGQWRIE